MTLKDIWSVEMTTKTAPKYRVIMKFVGDGHVYYREQFTNRIAIADQSCIGRYGDVLPPTCQDDKSCGVLYIDFDNIDDWDLPFKIDGLTGKKIYSLPLITANGEEYSTLILQAELDFLKRYF